jgi:hypothetical protein
MPQFYFDVTDGEFVPDFEGVELAGLEAARAHAIDLAADLLNANAAKFWRGEEWFIEVKDDCGLVVLTLLFVAREAPTVRNTRRSDKDASGVKFS